MIVIAWIVSVAVVWIIAACAVAWIHHVVRRRARDRWELEHDPGFPQRTRLDPDRRQVPHDSDGGRP